jgi:hypothetical protein
MLSRGCLQQCQVIETVRLEVARLFVRRDPHRQQDRC